MNSSEPKARAYRGRFAPSPTGALHFGSLVAALGSWLDARAAGGEWLVRIEDLDSPRCVPGADREILRLLDALALHWDGEVVLQSTRRDAYEAALDELRRRAEVYACTCSRTRIESRAERRARDGAWIYPGTCRQQRAPAGARCAWRIAVGSATIDFDDRLVGPVHEDLSSESGDFVLRRADGIHAYQLAVVVDDAWQGITDVVRGADLLDSTPRQIFLQQCLGLPRPRYLHLPVVTNAAGEKLSKQTGASPLRVDDAPRDLFEALQFLGLQPPGSLLGAGPATLLEWGITRWRAGSWGRDGGEQGR